MTGPDGVVLSTLEFDVLWEHAELPRRHAALDVPSPGATHGDRARLVARAWDSLAGRGFARGSAATRDLVDTLALFANARTGLDARIWTDRRITALAVTVGSRAGLGVVDGDEVWLLPARESSLAESVVSVAGGTPPGVGSSVSVPYEVLTEADAEARGDAKALVTSLEDRGVELWQAQELAGMLLGVVVKGQFGAQRAGRDGRPLRADRVVSFHDSDAGRYLFEVRPGAGGRRWATVAPADNTLLAQRVWELLDEI